MSISTEQAEKMVAEKMARENPKPEEQKSDTSTSGPEEQKQEKSNDETEDKNQEEKQEEKPADDHEEKSEAAKEPKETKPEAEKPNKKDKKRLPPSQIYTHEEQVAHRFAVEKRKRQDAQARVKELEAELAKLKGLKPEDFGNDVEQYTSYRLDEQKKKDEVERQKKFIEDSEAEESRLETERRTNLCFPNAEDRAEYENLVAENGREFYDALKKYDPHGVVLDYLDGVEKYPLVLKELMTNMKALAHVFRDPDPYELRHNLHVFTKDFLSGKPIEGLEEQKPEQPKPNPIPVIGKQVSAQAKPAEPVHDRAYWNEYLRKHPKG